MAWKRIEEEIPENRAATFGKEALRTGARTASNLATRAVGLPGDILSLGNEFIAKPLTESLTGQKGLPYEETFLGKAIPTTETHRRELERGTGEYLKPQNKIEEFADNVLEDAALLFFPGAKAATMGKRLSTGKKAIRNLTQSVGANLLGETASQATGSEKAGAWTKGTALFLSSLFNPGATSKQISQIYKSAESALPQNATTNASRLSYKLDTMEHGITGGRPKTSLGPKEKFIVDQIDKVRPLIQNGRIDINQLWKQKKSLNDELSSQKMFEFGRGERKNIKHQVKPLVSHLNKTLEEYGTTNPQFYKSLKDADIATGVLGRSNAISNFISNNIKYSPITHGLLHLFGGTLKTGLAPLTGMYQAGKLMYRVNQSPVLRNIYGKALKAATQEDSVAFTKYLKELDEKLQIEESKEKWKRID